MTVAKPLGLLTLLILLQACGSGGFTPVRTAFNRGVHFLSAQEYAAAAFEFREAVREDPGDYQARFNLAFALESLARHRGTKPEDRSAFDAEAETHYLTLLEQRPGHLRSLVNLASRAFEAGDAMAGEQYLRTAEAAHPTSPRPAMLRARWALRDGISSSTSP